MLLIITNSRDVTADYLAEALSENGVSFVRLDTDTALGSLSFSYRLHEPLISLGERVIAPKSVSNVWNRRPEPLCLPYETSSPEDTYAIQEWTAALEGFLQHIHLDRWVNHPAKNSEASQKLHQLTIAREIGLNIPNTIVTQSPSDLRDFFKMNGGRVIAKPLASGFIKRDKDEDNSFIYTNVVSDEMLNDLSDLTTCPTLFQQLIEKAADVRITIIDDHFHADSLICKDIDGSQACDIRRDNMNDVEYEEITIPSEIKIKLKILMRHYGLRFSAIDMVISKDKDWYFLEINPNGQWAWLDLVAGRNIAGSFIQSFKEAS